MPTEHYLQLGLLFIVTPLVAYYWQRYFRLPSAIMLALSLVVLNLLDTHSTMLFMQNHEMGISSEGNPFMRFAFEMAGFPLGLYLVKAFSFLIIFPLYRLAKRALGSGDPALFEFVLLCRRNRKLRDDHSFKHLRPRETGPLFMVYPGKSFPKTMRQLDISVHR